MRLIAALLLLAAATTSAAEVYRWIDAKGVVHYSDGPPNPDAKPVELPKLQTYRPTAAAPAAPPNQGEDAAKVSAAPISITAPRSGETIRDPDGRVSITVDATLETGQGLVYLLDGRVASGTPSPSTAYLLEGVERGEHTLMAALIASDGHELVRSAPVTIYLMPPHANPPPRKKG